jgi:hypothetical protein
MLHKKTFAAICNAISDICTAMLSKKWSQKIVSVARIILLLCKESVGRRMRAMLTISLREHCLHSTLPTCFIPFLSFFVSFLTEDSTKILVHAFIRSHIDYCNSLLYGIPKYQLDRLQRVLNAAARVVFLIPKFDHITPTVDAWNFTGCL